MTERYKENLKDHLIPKIMVTIKKIVPTASTLFAMVAMSFQLVTSQQLLWYPVSPTGDISPTALPGTPTDDCVIDLDTEICAVRLPQDHNFEHISETPDAQKAGRDL